MSDLSIVRPELHGDGWDELEHPDRECHLCRDLTREESCGETDQGWTCTREPGHDGPHVACGGDVHEMETWGAPDG